MKSTILFSFAMGFLLLIGCTQQGEVSSMLKNAETKDEVFTVILDDHEMMKDFMKKMMDNKHAMMMMQGDHNIMGKMMEDGKMMNMMKDKPEMMHNMMKDSSMMGHMMQMMTQEDMMSEECLQSCMKMMKDKGMSMDTGEQEKEDNDQN